MIWRDKLRPCPWCNETLPLVILTERCSCGKHHWVFVKCDKCGASGPTVLYHKETDDLSVREKIAAECWNNMQPKPALVKPVRDKETGRLWLCSDCGCYIGFEDNDEDDPNEFNNFCPQCGKMIDWNNRH